MAMTSPLASIAISRIAPARVAAAGALVAGTGLFLTLAHAALCARRING